MPVGVAYPLSINEFIADCVSSAVYVLLTLDFTAGAVSWNVFKLLFALL